jgi:Cell wall-associated hydrolases (invasion-associated proteins)
VKRQIFVLAVSFFLFSSLFLVSNVLANLYEVKKGDNLYTLSQEFSVSVKKIKEANSLQSNALKPGQILDIPERSANVSPNKAKSKTKASYYTVKSGDTLGTIARKTGVSVKQIMALNNIRPASLRIGQKLVLSKPGISTQKESITDDEEEEDITENIDLAELEKEKKSNEELLGKWNSPDERKLFIKVATGFLGAPYRLGGSTVRGIDCSAYVRKMYEFFDITLPRTAREQSTVGVSVEREELEEGDLVFFRTRRPIGHVGIYIGNNEFVHASRGSKAVRIDSLDRPYFQKRFRCAVRVMGLDSNNKGG